MAMLQLGRNMAKKLGATRPFSGFTAKAAGGRTAAPSPAVAQWSKKRGSTMAMQQLGRNMAKKLGATRAFSGFTAKAAGGRTAAPSPAVAQWPLSAGSGASFVRGHVTTHAPSIRQFSTGAEFPGGKRMGLCEELEKLSLSDYLHYQGWASVAVIASTALYYWSRYHVDKWGPLIATGSPKN